MEEWFKLDHFKMSIMEALDNLDQLVDESDPDVNLYPLYTCSVYC